MQRRGTFDHMFQSLEFSDRPPSYRSRASSSAPSVGNDATPGVRIRFITPLAAVSNVNISRIAICQYAFPHSTKVSEIAGLIQQRAIQQSSIAGAKADDVLDLAIADIMSLPASALRPLVNRNRIPNPSNDEDYDIDLHLAPFCLADGHATLADLRLEGTEQKPLDLFVVQRFCRLRGGLAPQLEDYNGLSAAPAWYPVPKATPASLSTFLCSLYMLRAKLTDETIRRRILTALWETTHFPPVIRAMAILFDNGKLRDSEKAVLAQTLYALARLSVPESVTGGGDPARIMEGSRQIIGWLVDQVTSRKRGGSGAPTEDVWCPKIIVEPRTASSDLDRLTGNVSVTVSIPSKQNRLEQFRVRYMCIDDRTHPAPEQLALAFSNISVHGGNYYLVFPRRFTNYQLHRIVSHPSPEGFYELVVNTNSIPQLGIIAPLSLARQPLPCLSLDARGRVAVFDLGRPCAPEFARYWSPVGGETPVVRNDRGQNIARTLEPIVRKKKQEGLWILDGWDIGGINISSVDTRPPTEAVVICMDVSYSMEWKSGLRFVNADGSLGEADSLSRLGRAKELFKLFSQTVSNLDVAVYFGGFSFAQTVQEFPSMRDRMTPLIDYVCEDVENLSLASATAVWDALHEAGEKLLRFKLSQPNSKLRVIALTDGEDNASIHRAQDVLQRLWSNEIVVDSVLIGNTNKEEHELFKFSAATGGYGIRPLSVADITDIAQMETLVDINLRPRNTTNQRLTVLPAYGDIPKRATYDLSRPPPIAPHPNQDDMYIKLSFARRAFRQRGMFTGNTAAATSARRIMEEIQDISVHPHPNMDVFVSERNLFVWKVIIVGPSQTTYESGTFVFLMDMTDDFPIRPPKLRFLTPILHPNITKQGRVCHPILDDSWTSSTSLRDVINNMFGLLIAPDLEGSAVDVMATLGYISHDKMFTAEVAAHIRRHAQQGRQRLSQAISSPVSDVGSPAGIFTPRTESEFDVMSTSSAGWADTESLYGI